MNWLTDADWLILGVSLCFSFLINALFLRFTHNLGMRNIESGEIRWASTSKPAFGGISFFIVFLFSIAAYNIFFVSRNEILSRTVFGIIASSSLGFLIGLADDSYNTKPFLKFAGQFACGLILIYSNILITVFSNTYLNQALTLFWVVGIMNSINMLDNMDAITTSVSAMILIGVIMVLKITAGQEPLLMFISFGTLGALLGFLFFNWHPSKMYMGDTGSQFLGALLSALGIICFWNTPFEFILHHPTKKILITIIVFIVPICDTTTVTINRLLAGKSPFRGGRDHTTHHLSYFGLSERKIALVMIGICAISLFVAFGMIKNFDWSIRRILFYSGYVLLVFLALYSTTLLTKGKKPKS
ncbi:MAG: glycosyltransferase family 4 protein [Bacteroidota bacterium]